MASPDPVTEEILRHTSPDHQRSVQQWLSARAWDEANSEYMGWNLYSYAVRIGDRPLTEYLEKLGALPAQGMDALLIRSIFEGHPEDANLALEGGANPNTLYSSGPAIEHAVFHGEPQIVQLLLHKGASLPAGILFKVCHWELADWKLNSEEDEKRYAEVVKILLCAGADPNERNEDGKTPLQAIEGDDLDLIEAVLKSAIEERS